MDAEPVVPPIPKDLLEFLEARHPEHYAEPTDTVAALMFHGGQREVVKWLRTVYEEQNRPVPEESSNVHQQAESTEAGPTPSSSPAAR